MTDPAHPSPEQLSAWDWLARIRPATWLHATGQQPHADQFTQFTPLTSGDDLQQIAPLVTHAAQVAHDARIRAWHQIAATACDEQHPTEIWWAIADAIWPEAAAAAGHQLHQAAHAAGLDPGHATARAVTLATAPPTTAWDAVLDIVTHAACTIAWRAIHPLAAAHAPIWNQHPDQAWATAQHTAHDAVRHITRHLERPPT